MSATCAENSNQVECLALEYAESTGAAVVASTGNHPRFSIGFPAADVRLIGAGGLQQHETGYRLWLQVGPNRTTDGECPDMAVAGDASSSNMLDCGSSGRWGRVFTMPGIAPLSYWPHDRAPEVSAPAYRVYSTFYSEGVWAPGNGLQFSNTCFDNNDGSVDNYGLCTGTSMAAPIIAGIAGLMRSTNPHLKVGGRDVLVSNGLSSTYANGFGYSVNRIAATGLRRALADALSIPGVAIRPAPFVVPTMPSPSDDDLFGAGLPDAEEAIRAVLGTIGGVPVVNRVTPAYYMHRLASGGFPIADLATVTVPQQASALEFNGYFHAYGLVGVTDPLLPPFSAMPIEPSLRGGFYVFTTPQKPVASWPASMQPIFLLDRNPSLGVQDLSWAVGEIDLIFRINESWDYLGRQGYLAPLQSFGFSSNCAYDSRLVMVHRVCSTTDCAVVTSDDVSAMQGHGFVVENTALGCAIRVTDSDNDHLPDGFEQIVGLNPFKADTDNDGCADGVEYSYTDLSTTDPGIAGSCP